MLAVKVSVNGEEVCTAGIDGPGLVNALLTLSQRESQATDKTLPDIEAKLHVGGVRRDAESGHDHLTWYDTPISIEDLITVQVVDVAHVDEPTGSTSEGLKEVEKREKAYYERLKTKYGE
jgi:hypothetical protein